MKTHSHFIPGLISQKMRFLDGYFFEVGSGFLEIEKISGIRVVPLIIRSKIQSPVSPGKIWHYNSGHIYKNNHTDIYHASRLSLTIIVGYAISIKVHM